MAATTQSFSAMLKRYQSPKLHMNEIKKHNWFINWVEKKQDWVGGTMEIPFEAAQSANFSWGALPASNDLGEDTFLQGTLTDADLKELWGTQKYHNKDLRRHGDMKKSYLKILPARMNRFSELMSQMVSITYLGDGSIDLVSVNGTAGGAIGVHNPHRFNIGQKIVIDDDDTSAATGYITAININTKLLTVEDARSGGSAVDLSDYTTAQNAKIYNPGQADKPQALEEVLLSSTNGGAANYFGYTKADYPILQAKNASGASFTQATLLDDLYGAYYDVLEQGKGSLDKTMVVPMRFMQYITPGLENNKRYVKEDVKIGYGVKEVSVLGPDGMCKIVGIRDKSLNSALILDKAGVKLCGNSFFKRDTDANGNEFTVERNTTGKVNIVDTCFEASLVVTMPQSHGIVHSIPTVLPAS